MNLSARLSCPGPAARNDPEVTEMSRPAFFNLFLTCIAAIVFFLAPNPVFAQHGGGHGGGGGGFHGGGGGGTHGGGGFSGGGMRSGGTYGGGQFRGGSSSGSFRGGPSAGAFRGGSNASGRSFGGANASRFGSS